MAAGINVTATILVLLLVVLTIAISIFSRRFTRTTADFYLAGRKVGSFSNASAISGDYLSAASFLGVAGAVYASGLDGVWFAAGFAGGFMVVVLFLASALRRFGEYTVADFAFGRFGTNRMRLLTVLAVLLVSLFYLAPQMYGSGTTWQVLVGAGIFGMDAYTTGVVVVSAIMAFYVAVGGMKGTTINQIFQFWWLWIAMFLVAVFAMFFGIRGATAGYPTILAENSSSALVVTKSLTVKEATTADPKTGKTPMDSAVKTTSAESLSAAAKVVAAGDPIAKVPLVLGTKSKLRPEAPMIFNQPGHRYNPLDQFSMVLALVLGTAGLPHILNRYYTNPSGRAARRSTFWVLVFIGTFYICAPYVGAAGRWLIPKAVALGAFPANIPVVDGLLMKSDQVVPATAQILGGDILMGIAAAGAFAAMFSTIGGLLIAAASAVGHDVYEKYINPNATEAQRVMVGKIAVLAVATISLGVGLGIPAAGLDKAYPALIAMMVTWAFSIGASAFVPMLLTGIWWKKTTERGALAGMFVGLFGAIGIIVLNILQATGIIGVDGAIGFVASLTYPVIFTFPLSLGTVIAVSLLDKKLPDNVDQIWMRIHGTASERHERQHGLDKVGSLLGGKKG
jgi:cation/acetate symporter